MADFYKGEAKPTEHSDCLVLLEVNSHHPQPLNGARIRVVADNCGTSEAEIESTYYRLNNLLNIEELGFHRKVVSQDVALVVGDV